MTTETFFANFGHLADAPNGVKKLRELILQLAVQGKLVPQDPEVEPAEALLERIEAEKKRLVREGKIKKLTTSAPVKAEELPFAAPQVWKWPRLDSICSYIQRGKGPQYVDKSDVPVVSQKCVQWAGFSLEPARFICPMSLDRYAEERFLQTGDLLWNSTGTGTIGRINVYVHEENPYELVVADSHVTVVRPVFVNSRYVWIWLASPFIQTDLEGNASGSTNQVELSTSVVKAHVIPLPPFAEQKRIVTKVDQLMALCDELETRQKKQQQGRVRLNAAALDKLLTAREPAEFADHWQRISTNFDLLYDHPETIAKLRAAILQLAVQGKLVPQDPNDEPASVLLEKLRADRKAWLEANATGNPECRTAINKLKKLKKPGLSFRIPDTWQFAKLIDCCELLVDCHNKTAPYAGFGIPIIRTTNVRDRAFKMVNLKYVSEETYQFWSRRCAPKPADIIFTREAPMGEAAIIPDGEKYCLGQRTMLIRPMHDYMMNSYLLITLTEPNLLERTSHNAIGSTVKHFRVGDVESFDIAVPPLEEQKRIVAKVDQLMTLCDELETKLNQVQQHSEKLMEATVRQLLVA